MKESKATLSEGVTEPEAVGRVDTARGASLGRFLVLAGIGAGGMGVVVAAYDPELDRRVALKLLHPGHGGVAAQRRLQHEARAMARLSHPNVVTVYEVGEVENRIYIAMELVEGETVRRWVAAEPRSVGEVLETFVAAGRGLAAAHAAGLVHRDFKPDNVLIGGDGRVRVADFGLASESSPSTEDPGSEGVEVAGTPPYMAPEQHAPGAVDARADQFAFCVSLYEALYGERPFEGDTRAELAGAIRAQRVREPVRGHKVPAWLRAVVLRGLRARPEERYPSMDALLRALRRDPAATRRRVIVAAAIALVGGAALAGVAGRGGGAAPCTGARDRLASVWDASARDQVRTAFLGTGQFIAIDTFERVAGTLDGYADRWAAMHTEVCRATRVHGEQSEQLLDLRMTCLDRRRSELSAFVRALAGARDRATIERAVQAAAELGAVEDCADSAQLQATTPMPGNPVTRALVERALVDLGDVAVASRLAQNDAAGRLLEDVAARGHGTGYAPLDADIAFWRGNLAYAAGDYGRAEAAHHEAIARAAAARDLRREARAWAALLGVMSMQPKRLAESRQVIRAAEAAVERAGRPPSDYHRVRRNVGATLSQAGEMKEALRVVEELLAESPDADPWDRAAALTAKAASLVALARTDEVLTSGREALALWEKLLGPDHPRVATALEGLGRAYALRGEVDAAEVALSRALRIKETALGADHVSLWKTLSYLADVAAQRGDLDGLRRRVGRAIALLEKAGPDHDLKRLQVMTQGGHALYTAGAFDEAEAALRRSLAFAAQHRLGDVPHVGIAQFYLGTLLVERGRGREGLSYCDAASASMLAAYGTGNDYEGALLVCQGQGRTLLKRPAVAMLERALRLIDDGDSEPGEVAGARFALARALVAETGDVQRAVELARRARDELAAGGPGTRAALLPVEAWLAQHDKARPPR